MDELALAQRARTLAEQNRQALTAWAAALTSAQKTGDLVVLVQEAIYTPTGTGEITTSYAPLGGAQVSCPPRTPKTTAADGIATFSRLDPGVYQVTASKKDYTTASGRATIVAGKTTSLTLTITRLISEAELERVKRQYRERLLAEIEEAEKEFTRNGLPRDIEDWVQEKAAILAEYDKKTEEYDESARRKDITLYVLWSLDTLLGLIYIPYLLTKATARIKEIIEKFNRGLRDLEACCEQLRRMVYVYSQTSIYRELEGWMRRIFEEAMAAGGPNAVAIVHALIMSEIAKLGEKWNTGVELMCRRDALLANLRKMKAKEYCEEMNWEMVGRFREDVQQMQREVEDYVRGLSPSPSSSFLGETAKRILFGLLFGTIFAALGTLIRAAAAVLQPAMWLFYQENKERVEGEAQRLTDQLFAGAPRFTSYAEVQSWVETAAKDPGVVSACNAIASAFASEALAYAQSVATA